MLKEHTQVLQKFLVLVDMALIALGFFASAYVRAGVGAHAFDLSENVWFLPAILLCWTVLLHRFGMYRSFRIKDVLEVLAIVLQSAFFALLFLAGMIFLLKMQGFSRTQVALTFILGTTLLCVEKAALILLFRSVRRKGYNYRNILVVGTNKRAQHFIELVRQHAEWGLRIIGIVDADPQKKGTSLLEIPVIGTFEEFPELLHANVVDEVVFVVPRSWLERIQSLVRFCETEGIRVSVAVDIFEMRIARAKQTDLHGFPLMSFETTTDKIWHLIFKRFVDFAGSGAGLLVLLPFLALVGLLIKLTSAGPVFFRQQRSSLSGRTFWLYKFRTMRVGAEAELKELRALNEMKGPVFKMANDPRVTPLGRWLRKLSIDELPQLWNVFKGDMSLVGPRPPVPSEVKQYDSWHRRKLSMRPGITCLWQVSGRNKITDFDEWMKLDLEYIDNWSLWLDFKILVKTIPAVLFAEGAK